MPLVEDDDSLAAVVAQAHLLTLSLHPYDDVPDAGPGGEPGVEEAEFLGMCVEQSEDEPGEQE